MKIQNARDKLLLHNILKIFVKREGKLPIILLLPITKLSYNISLHPFKELAEMNILRQRLQRNNFATLVDLKQLV